MKHKKNLFWLSIILFVAIFIALPLKAQVTIGDETSPQTYSVLELIGKYSTAPDKYGGLRLPQLTTAQRDGLDVTPSDSLSKGLVIYNTDNNCIEYWNSKKWISLCSGSASTIIKTGDGSDPFDPNNPNTEPNDPGSSVFPKDGGEKGPFTPDDSPACTAQDPPYQIFLITGGEYSKITVLDASTGEFKLTMEANPAARVRYAIVRVVNNCTGAYRDFTYTQDGQNIGIRPDLTQSPIPAPGGQFGPYTPETNPENCPPPVTYTITPSEDWCTAVTTDPTTGAFYLIFQPNYASTPRYVDITIKAMPCDISSTYTVKQLEQNCETVNAGTISGNNHIKTWLGETTTKLSTNGMPGGTWTSSKPEVADVSSTGLVTRVGSAYGAVPITYTVGAGACISSAIDTVYVGCGAYTTSGEWLVFMCHNLGADESLDPFTWNNSKGDSDGYDIKGDLYQWGRPKDGHEKRNSETTSTLATTTIPGHSNFITTSATPHDWLSGGGSYFRWGDGTQNENMPKAANDPCPTGWKVPSDKQWASIYGSGVYDPTKATGLANTWTWTGYGFKIGNALYLPGAGYRPFSGGPLYGVGMSIAYYWSSAVTFNFSGTPTESSQYLHIAGGHYVGTSSSQGRAYGISVRCVQE